MMTTPAEARNRKCCGPYATRGNQMLVNECMVDQCMAWRWADDKRTEGYCGIAGTLRATD